jgi:hypothetical protein
LSNLTIPAAGTLAETLAKLQWHLSQLTALAAALKESGHPITVAAWTKNGTPLLCFDRPLPNQITRLPSK